MKTDTLKQTPPEFYEFQNVADFNTDGVPDAVRVAKLKSPSVEAQKGGLDELDTQPWIARIVFMNADGTVQSEQTADDLGYGCSIAETLNDADKIAMVSLRADVNGDGKRDVVSIERESFTVDDYNNGTASADTPYTGIWLLKHSLGAANVPMGVAQAPKKSVTNIKPATTQAQDDLVSRGPVVVSFN
jgi:hypothetical protein